MTPNERYEIARKLIEEGSCSPITTIMLRTLCDYLRVGPRTICRRVSIGLLPTGIKRGREKVWRVIDIRKAVEKEMKKTRWLA